MLGKLIKYELQAGSRYYLPLFLLIAITALTCRLLAALSPSSWLEWLVGFFFVLLLTAMFVITFVITIQRFYKNLLGEEGYLMFTLPVSTHSLLLSKLSAALIWNIACFGVLLIAIELASYGGSLFDGFISAMPANLDQLGDMLLFALICLLCLMAALLFFYLAMAIGQLFGQHRLLASFGAVIGMSMLQQILLVLAVLFGFKLLAFDSLFNSVSPDSIGALAVATAILSLLAICAIYYFITYWLLHKKLNLQ